MKKLFTILLLSILMPAAQASIAEARAAFERAQVEPFARSVLLDHTVAPAASCYDKAPGKAAFAFAMPYASDMRLKFVTGTFDGGRFVSAQLHVLGFAPQAIDAAAFERLRDEKTMVAVRTQTDDVNPIAVLYPARNARETLTVTDNNNLSFNAVAFRLGAIGCAIGRVGTTMTKLAYQVTLTGKDGYAVDLGVATAKEALAQKVVMQRIRAALEKRDPARKGMVSDRDIVDFRAGGTLSLKAVPPAK